MNSLSWFLYLAEVTDSLKGVSIFFSIMFGIAFVFWLAAKAFSGHDKEAMDLVRSTWFVPWVFSIATLFAVITPSKGTLYLIAGAEAGEMVVTSEAGQEILNDIKEVIQFQLSEMKGENKSSDTP